MEIVSRKSRGVLKVKSVYKDDNTAIRFFLDTAQAAGFSGSCPDVSAHYNNYRHWYPHISGRDSHGDEYDFHFGSDKKVSGISEFLSGAEIDSYRCGEEKCSLFHNIEANNPDGIFTNIRCAHGSYGAKEAIEITVSTGRPNFHRQAIAEAAKSLKDRLSKYDAEIEVLQ